MKTMLCRSVLTIVMLAALSTPALSGIATTASRKAVQESLELAARRSGRKLGDKAARKAAAGTLDRLARRYGDDVLKVVRDGGLELVEAAPRYGDDVIEFGLKASPAARRALAMDVPGLLPLVRRAGVEVIELEARTPGLAARVFSVFGDDAGRMIAKSVPTEDIPRLLAYANKADTPATRELMLQAYKKEGKVFFERVPPQLVLLTGLSASMIYGTHRVTMPTAEMGKAIRRNEGMAETAIRQFFSWGALIIFLLSVILLWRFGLVPWRRKGRNVADSARTSRRKEFCFEFKKNQDETGKNAHKTLY